VTAYFFQADSGDQSQTLTGLNPATSGTTPNLGHGPTITSTAAAVNPGTTAGTWRTSGWQDLVLAPTPTKHHLFAQLFSQKNAAGSAGRCQAIDIDLRARWVA